MFQRGFSGRYPLHGKEISCNLYPGSSLVKKRPKPPVPPRASGPSAGGRRHHHAGVRPAQLAGEPAAPCGVQPAQLAGEPAAPPCGGAAGTVGGRAGGAMRGAAGTVGGRTGGAMRGAAGTVGGRAGGAMRNATRCPRMKSPPRSPQNRSRRGLPKRASPAEHPFRGDFLRKFAPSDKRCYLYRDKPGLSYEEGTAYSAVGVDLDPLRLGGPEHHPQRKGSRAQGGRMDRQPTPRSGGSDLCRILPFRNSLIRQLL